MICFKVNEFHSEFFWIQYGEFCSLFNAMKNSAVEKNSIDHVVEIHGKKKYNKGIANGNMRIEKGSH